MEESIDLYRKKIDSKISKDLLSRTTAFTPLAEKEKVHTTINIDPSHSELDKRSAMRASLFIFPKVQINEDHENVFVNPCDYPIVPKTEEDEDNTSLIDFNFY